MFAVLVISVSFRLARVVPPNSIGSHAHFVNL